MSVAVVDYGLKHSILNRLQAADASVTVYPHVCDPDDLATHDGVLLSNGPGDPAPLVEETRVVRETLGRVPMLGICLGHQLMGLATGHETTKLPVRASRREPSRARQAQRPCPRHEPEPRLRGGADRWHGGDARVALRRHGRGLRLPRAPRRLASSSIPRRGRGRTTPGRSSSAGSKVSHADAGPPRHPLDLRDRLWSDRDRAGVRVRLRRLPGAQGPARGRLPDDRRSTRTRRRS